jgi:cell division protein FtsL
MKLSQGIRFFLLILLGHLLFISAMAVVYQKHRSRQLFIELQSLQREIEFLQVEWSQLLLEQGTWASDARVERLARSQLQMVLPEADQVIVISEQP